MKDKSRFITTCFALMALAAAGVIALTNTGCQDSQAAADTKKIVLIAGQPSHPSGQHEFNAGSIILARCLNEQSGLPLKVEVVHNGWPEDETVFDGADAVVIYSDGNSRHPVNGHEAKMDELAAKGVGFMFMHYGVEVPPGEQGDKFKNWIGGHYESGFSTNPHWTAAVEIDSTHPVGRGVPNFSANDEWYYNIRFADPKSKRDLLTAVPSYERINRYIHWTPKGKEGIGKRQTMMWAIERPDGGRGIGFTGGHWHRNWAIDDFRTIVLNGMIWVAKLDVPENGVSSDPVTEAMLNENLDEKKTMEQIKMPSESDLTQPAAKEIDFRWPGYPPKKKK